jgi:hypothetical protein
LTTPVALYVMPDGPYPTLLGPERCWDEVRNAKGYTGTDPVVAHPPCGPWSKLRHMCTKQDPDCGPRAFEQVRATGGVLEHPEHSSLFTHVSAPRPGESPDQWGGETYYVEQVAFGHACVKPTWIYVVGAPSWLVRASIREGGTATHCVCTGPRQAKRLPVAHKGLKMRSPRLFAMWLVALASVARR